LPTDLHIDHLEPDPALSHRFVEVAPTFAPPLGFEVGLWIAGRRRRESAEESFNRISEHEIISFGRVRAERMCRAGPPS
jgi:hypothetical protein